jgi:hypothetical protein
MAEKSGLEMLEEIIERLNMIDKRLNIMDQNIKTIANSAKIADLVDKLSNTPLDNWSKAIKPGIQKENAKDKIKDIKKSFSNFKFESSDGSKDKDRAPVSKKRSPSVTSNIMVRGKMVANAGEQTLPLANISVKIYDAKDNLVKETKTNRAGQWLSQLAPGDYIALFEGELRGKKLVPQNRNFTVPEKLSPGQQYFEVI